MIEERTVGDDPVVAGCSRCGTGLLHNLVEDALHIADMDWGLALGRSDGWRGLGKGGGGHQGDKHEFRFHGWYELRLGWLDCISSGIRPLRWLPRRSLPGLCPFRMLIPCQQQHHRLDPLILLGSSVSEAFRSPGFPMRCCKVSKHPV